MSEVTDKIRSRAYWDISIMPEPFNERRLGFAVLGDLVASHTVRLRGWPVPYTDYREETLRGDDWLGQDIDAKTVSHIEAWRMFRSGQFSHLRAVDIDWRPLPSGEPRSESADVVEVWEILYYLTEVFELAARLALSPAGDETMTVRANLFGLNYRSLIVGQSNRAEFWDPKGPGPTKIEREVTLPRNQLVAEAREQAVDMARDYFDEFSWTVSREQLLDHQRQLTDR